ncbi:MAG TPA: DUF3054 family protein [Actinomycetota bacterium]|nr:DUF3054 family protein [Actinomycetota bacterium]
MRRSVARPSPRAAAAIDAVALASFVVVGVIQHGGLALAGIARTGVPLLVAWFLVALLVGTYRRVGWGTMLVTWLIAVPLGLIGRSLIRGGPWGEGLLEFGAIAMGFTLLFVVAGRGLLLGASLLRQPAVARDRA